MSLQGLRSKIADKSALLGVVGLGYVGLPVACLFAGAGFAVRGVDLKAARVEQINAGLCPIEGEEPGLAALLQSVVASRRLRASGDFETLRNCDVVLVNVETPVHDDRQPEYHALRSALDSLAPVLKPGALVVVESTLAPGTMDGLVLPNLEARSGWRVNETLFLGHCPERVMPGKLLKNMRTMSRVVGGMSPATSDAMTALYRCVVEADLDPCDCLTAELVKTAENAYRDVNIAFANELALICEAAGADVWRVRELVNKSPGRNVLFPGAGVGGHCIPKDPWLLAHGAQGKVSARLIAAAREVNDSMPAHVARLAEEALRSVGKGLAGSRILVLGYAYLENSDDTRNSPSEALTRSLAAAGAETVIHDPHVRAYQGDVLQRARGCDAAILMVAHDAYRSLDLAKLQEALRTPVLVDGRHLYDAEQARAAGLVFRAIGQGVR